MSKPEGPVGGFWPPASPSPGHDSREAASAPPSNFVLTPPAYMLSRCTSHICQVHSQQNNVLRPFSGIHQAVYCLLTTEVFLLTHEDAVQSQDKPGRSHSTWTRAQRSNAEEIFTYQAWFQWLSFFLSIEMLPRTTFFHLAKTWLFFLSGNDSSCQLRGVTLPATRTQEGLLY